MTAKLKRKLRSQRGETLLESIVAILVIVFSGLTLFFSITTAARVNHAATIADEAFVNELRAAEKQQGVMKGSIIIEAGGGEDRIEVDVFYTGGEGELTSYKLR